MLFIIVIILCLSFLQAKYCIFINILHGNIDLSKLLHYTRYEGFRCGMRLKIEAGCGIRENFKGGMRDENRKVELEYAPFIRRDTG